MPWCPKCTNDYSEAVDRCPKCKTALVGYKSQQSPNEPDRLLSCSGALGRNVTSALALLVTGFPLLVLSTELSAIGIDSRQELWRQPPVFFAVSTTAAFAIGALFRRRLGAVGAVLGWFLFGVAFTAMVVGIGAALHESDPGIGELLLFLVLLPSTWGCATVCGMRFGATRRWVFVVIPLLCLALAAAFTSAVVQQNTVLALPD